LLSNPNTGGRNDRSLSDKKISNACFTTEDFEK